MNATDGGRTSGPGSKSKSNTGPIIGGVLGGIIGSGLVGGGIFWMLRRRRIQQAGRAHTSDEAKNGLNRRAGIEPFLLPSGYESGDTRPRSDNMVYASLGEEGRISKKRLLMNDTDNRASFGANGLGDSQPLREGGRSSQSGIRTGTVQDGMSSSVPQVDMTNEELRNEVGNLRRDFDRIRRLGLLDSGSEAPPRYEDD